MSRHSAEGGVLLRGPDTQSPGNDRVSKVPGHAEEAVLPESTAPSQVQTLQTQTPCPPCACARASGRNPFRGLSVSSPLPSALSCSVKYVFSRLRYSRS